MSHHDVEIAPICRLQFLNVTSSELFRVFVAQPMARLNICHKCTQTKQAGTDKNKNKRGKHRRTTAARGRGMMKYKAEPKASSTKQRHQRKTKGSSMTQGRATLTHVTHTGYCGPL